MLKRLDTHIRIQKVMESAVKAELNVVNNNVSTVSDILKINSSLINNILGLKN